MTTLAEIASENTTAASANIDELERTFAAAPDTAFRARCISEYGRLRGWIKDRVDWSRGHILDFGCGEGHAAASIALRHPNAKVVGLDVDPVSLSALRSKLKTQTSLPLPENLRFVEQIDDGSIADGEYDVVYAWSVIEHISNEWLLETMREIRDKLREGGFFFVWCDPLYHSPKGSLLHRYNADDWHHFLFSIEKLQECVLSQSTATAAREWQQFLGLNRLTADDIIEAGLNAGFRVDRELRFRSQQRPPERLSRIYNLDVLTTASVQILFVK